MNSANFNLDSIKKMRQEGKKISFSGNGFFVIELDEFTKLQVWSQKYMSFQNLPHTHNKRFRAEVLLGEIKQEIFYFVADPIHGEEKQFICDGKSHALCGKGHIVPCVELDLRAGSTYTLPTNCLHSITKQGFGCILKIEELDHHLEKIPIFVYVDEFEEFYGLQTYEKDMSVDKMWDEVEEVCERLLSE